MRRRLLLTFLLLAAHAASARAGDEGEDVLGPLPWHADEATFFLRRIVDGSTGAPVTGATVKLFAEVPHPEPGFGVPSATATSGPDGWVRIQKDQLDAARTALYGEPSWAYVEAPGLGPDAVFRTFLVDEDWPLRPAAELRVTLRDPLDRPVRGARVGWLLGCGHTPDVRHAVTDEHGVARLVGVQDEGNGQIWFVKEGFVSRYLTDQAWRPGTPERLARVEWGAAIEGTVVRHDGTPAKGVAVGRSDCHRGPWIRTDAAGRFRLVGLAARPGDSVGVEPHEYGVADGGPFGTAVDLVVPVPGHQAVVRLPAPGEDPAEETAARPLVVALTSAAGAQPAAIAREVLAVRLTDGWTTDGEANADGIAELAVRPGTYLLYARFSDDASLADLIRGPTVVVGPGADEVRAQMALPVPQVLEVRFEVDPDSVDAEVITEGRTARLLPEPLGLSIRVPVWPARPTFLRVEHGPRAHLTPIDPSRPVRVAPPERVRVRARLLDPEGKPARGWLLDEDLTDGFHLVPSSATLKGPASETPELETLAGARARLVVWPEDHARFQPVRLPLRDLAPVSSGGAPSAPVDLGDVRLPPRVPSLFVEEHAGHSLTGVRVTVTRGMRQQEFTSDAHASGEVVDPWHEPGLVTTGAVVRVTDWMVPRAADAPDAGEVVTVPFVRRLAGPGPWHLRPPAGSLALEIAASEGETLSRLSLRLDGGLIPLGSTADEVRRLLLVGLEAGSHQIVVEAKDHHPRRFAFTLAEGETRRIAARLTPIPPPR